MITERQETFRINGGLSSYFILCESRSDKSLRTPVSHEQGPSRGPFFFYTTEGAIKP